MRKTPVQGHHQKKESQRSAPQSTQKYVPDKQSSLLNSVVGENLEHDPEELEC